MRPGAALLILTTGHKMDFVTGKQNLFRIKIEFLIRYSYRETIIIIVPLRYNNNNELL